MVVDVYEVYNEVECVQFVLKSEAEEYMSSRQGYSLRVVKKEMEDKDKARGWLQLEQALYQSALFAKVTSLSLSSHPLAPKMVFGFSFLCKVLTDGKTTGASENALQQALTTCVQILQSAQEITQEEKEYINKLLETNNFNFNI